MVGRSSKQPGKKKQERVRAGSQPEPQEVKNPVAQVVLGPQPGTDMVKDSSIT